MWKETIICILIILTIIWGNYMTQSYTKESVSELNRGLENLRQNLKQNEVDQEATIHEMREIYEKWKSRHDKLAYFIEHDELEKVETELISIQSYMETKEYEESISALDKSGFILKHIEDKYAFNLQNIF